MKYAFPRMTLLASSILALGMAGANASTQATTNGYTLAFLAGDVNNVSAINNAGQIAGSALVMQGNDYFNKAAVWNGTAMTVLSSAAGANSDASAINGSGVAVGSSHIFNTKTHSTTSYANVWNGAAISNLPNGVNATGINDAGTVVGYSNNHAMLWHGSIAKDLNVSGAAYSMASGINTAGIVVGSSDNNAVAWNGTSAIVLGTLSTNSGQSNYINSATAINNNGQIVGTSDSGGLAHATSWTQNSAGTYIATDLGFVQGSVWDPINEQTNYNDSSRAFGINKYGAVVGSSFSSVSNPAVAQSMRATLWSGGQAFDLNSYLSQTQVSDGIQLVSATGINDFGFIVGNAENIITGQVYGFELTPSGTLAQISSPALALAVPEPAEYGMLTVGIALVGLVSRKRKTVKA